MLTPEQITQWRTASGLSPTPPTGPTPGVIKPLSERLGLVAPQPPKEPGLFSRIGTDIAKRGANVEADISGTSPESQGENPLVRGVQAASEGFSAVADTGGEILKSLFGALEKVSGRKGSWAAPSNLPQPVKDFGNNVKGGLEMANDELGTILNDWATKHPEAGKALESSLKILSGGGNIAGTIAAADVGSMGANKIPGLGSDVTDFASNARNIYSKVEDTVNAAGEKVLNTPSALKGKVANTIQGKAEAEILATPKEQVYKLNPAERKLWFDNEAGKITSQAEETTTKIKADLQAKADAASKTTEDLQKQLAVASRDKVIELRPKIVKAMGEQSKIYRGLIEEEMAGKENLAIKVDDLKAHIDSQYGDNPGMANTIKEKLGLTETPETLKKGQLPTIQTQPQTKTLGDLYNQTKALRQDISAGAVKGNKVFTSADKLTDDAIHTLTDFMKQNGVDFSEANKFWSKYAPIRDQLVSEAKPFIQTETKTKTFAGTLKRVAEGVDVNNENFIKETEKLVGEPVTKEAKAIVSKLDATEKANLANKVEAEAKLVENEMAKDKSLAKLSSEQFEIERKARVRSRIKKVIIAGLGLLGAKELGITRFFGL